MSAKYRINLQLTYRLCLNFLAEDDYVLLYPDIL